MEKSQLGQLLAKGGEGEIFTTTDPGLVAKIYHQGKMTPAVEQKLRSMLANPPHDSMRAQGRVSIAWVVDLVTVNGIVQGYVMPRLEKAQAERLNDPALNPSTCRDLIDFYNPSTRRKNFPWFHYLYLLRTARNIAAAVDSFHAKGYVIGDVNESNILVALDTIVTFVDTDSFQVPDCGKVHRCQVGKPEYTPPELQGVSFKDIDRTQAHDLFGLGVIIFQLLMQGQHPFAGVYRGHGDAPEIKNRIEAGYFPHVNNVLYAPVPLAPPFDILPSRLQRLFIECFDNGYHNPDNRPTAKQWRDALVEAEQEMNRCAINEHHFYANHLSRCPWCELSQKFGGRDPFPSQAEIQQSWGLKMSPSLIQPTTTILPQASNSVLPITFISSQSSNKSHNKIFVTSIIGWTKLWANIRLYAILIAVGLLSGTAIAIVNNHKEKDLEYLSVSENIRSSTDEKVATAINNKPTLLEQELNRIIAQRGECVTITNNLNSSVDVYSTPNMNSGTVVGHLSPFTVIIVTSNKNGWLEINNPVKGWVGKLLTLASCSSLNYYPPGAFERFEKFLAKIGKTATAGDARAIDFLVRYDNPDGIVADGVYGHLGEVLQKHPDLFISTLDVQTEDDRRRVIDNMSLFPCSKIFKDELSRHKNSPTARTCQSLNKNVQEINKKE